MKKYKGKFITFEGIDGAGKTLQAEMLADYFEKRKEKFLVVREPGTTSIGEKIREILVDKNNNDMSCKTETLLFMASRAQIVTEKIIPALRDGFTVVCDRFIDSSVVYQGVGRNIGIDSINQLNDFVTDGLVPDITFFIDVSPEIVLQRKIDLGEPDRFESEELNFHWKIYEAYKDIAKNNPERFVIIDGCELPEKINETITSRISSM